VHIIEVPIFVQLEKDSGLSHKKVKRHKLEFGKIFNQHRIVVEEHQIFRTLKNKCF
jgi:hypothetical protein